MSGYMDMLTDGQADMNRKEDETVDEFANGTVTDKGNVDFVEAIQAENERRARTGKDDLRTDIHRRGAFQPDQYRFFGWYWLRWSVSGRTVPGRSSVERADARVQAYLASEEAQDFKAMVYGDFGRCGVCGARFACGEIWQHTERMDLVHIGCDCCEKYEMVSGTDWNAVKDERERHIKGLKTAIKNAAARERIAAEHPDYVEAIEFFVAQKLDTPFGFIRSMCDSWKNSPAKVTPNMIKATIVAASRERERLARKAKIDAERAAEVKCAAPTGRVTVRGVVVSIKDHESEWGVTRKMTVKVTTDAGVYLVWTTVPTNLFSSYDHAKNETTDGVARGDEVEFDAKLEHGKDPFFAFGKRPTKASIIKKGGAS
jgi:hypothetical protein